MMRKIEEKRAARARTKDATYIYSDDNNFWWIKHVQDDLYHLKHNHQQPHEFPYREKEIKHCYKHWLFESCRLNTGHYIFINIEGEDSPYGEITALKHSNDGWHGKFTGECEETEYKMSKGWVNKLFRDHFQTSCIGNNNTWLRVPPGNPRQTMQTNTPVLH